jgi:hypothetical protein
MRDPRVNVLDKETFDEWRGRKKAADFNRLAHEQAHAPRLLIYTSKATIPTTAGSRWYPIRAGKLLRAMANVQVAPTSTLTWKLLKNGTDVFTTDPTISNESGAYPIFDDPTEWIDNPIFVVGDYFQFQVSTVGGATGPFVGTLEYMYEEVA